MTTTDLAPLDTTDMGALLHLAVAGTTSPHTRRAYQSSLREFIAWMATTRAHFDRGAVTQYRAWLVDQGKTASTVNRHLSAIRALAREAQAAFLLPEVVALGIASIKNVPKNGTTTGRWLDADEAKRLLFSPDAATVRGKRDRAILGLLIGTGIRRTECAELLVEQVVKLSGRWAIADLRRKHHRLDTVPMPAWAHERLATWWEAAGIHEGAAFRRFQYDRVDLARPLTQSGVWLVVQACAAAAGLGKINPHDLRRTCAKLSRDGGADLRDIQRQLGHAQLATTDTYLAPMEALENPACDRITCGKEETHE